MARFTLFKLSIACSIHVKAIMASLHLQLKNGEKPFLPGTFKSGNHSENKPSRHSRMIRSMRRNGSAAPQSNWSPTVNAER